jgi:hypothetical protein
MTQKHGKRTQVEPQTERQVEEHEHGTMADPLDPTGPRLELAPGLMTVEEQRGWDAAMARAQKDLQRIRGALGAMPFGAMATTRSDDCLWDRRNRPVSAEAIVLWLEKLAEVLREHSDDCTDRQARLRELENQRDAVRSFFGVG